MARSPVPPFARAFLTDEATFTRIGDGELGGKASGLWFIKEVLASGFDATRFSEFVVDVPRLTVITTDVFDRFITLNQLGPIVEHGLPDDRLALAFQQAEFPPELVGDLRALVEQVRLPLAVRSSSRLEDALYRPFAGVYATKMIPNNQPDPDTRFRRLVEAIKFVYASTFFQGATSYRSSAAEPDLGEKMAVVVQEVAGRRHGDRFYPDVSGVARSWNFYPAARARAEDGVVNLALGLGKTIVDGGTVWSYSPAWPRAAPPFASARELVRQTQTRFWAVNMGAPPAFNPIAETEYLLEGSLADAEYDGTIHRLASTYDLQSDRLVPGTGRAGPRALTFAPLLDLEVVCFNPLVKALVACSEAALEAPVEVEFAVAFPDRRTDPVRFAFLQVRPMAVSSDRVEVPVSQFDDPRVLVASERTMGNGHQAALRDVVFVRPDTFDKAHMRAIAAELESVNRAMLTAGRHYVLIGFGRWGSSDPWLGIPVDWARIGQARCIVEAQTESLRAEPSQGSHFFHNLTSFGVTYFMLTLGGRSHIDWDWLMRCPAAHEGPFVRRVTFDSPLSVTVDGRSGRGVILKP